VQSSVILQPGWLKALESTLDNDQCDVAFGRLVDEGCPTKIWADGHSLRDGKTLNWNYEKSTGTVSQTEPSCPRFACLSAALFRGELVKKIVDKYGDFVFSGIDHYGDCTDVALRAKAATNGNATFKFCKDAVATKRWPNLNQRAVLTSQIVAGALYFEGRQNEATERLKRKPEDSQFFVDAINVAERILRLPYSVSGTEAPSATPFEKGLWQRSNETAE
jgi:hypothetical protein